MFDAKTGELLGAHMIGAEVTELIQGYVVARQLETTEAELMHTVFPHPTLSEMMHESVLDAYGRAMHIERELAVDQRVTCRSRSARTSACRAKSGDRASPAASAMLTEGIYSVVDSTNQLASDLGLKRRCKPADEREPVGDGRELYFWSFIAPASSIALGAARSSDDGVIHIDGARQRCRRATPASRPLPARAIGRLSTRKSASRGPGAGKSRSMARPNGTVETPNRT